jgi:hypothetical protein
VLDSIEGARYGRPRRAPRQYGCIPHVHWESPVVANGRLYVTDEDGNLTAFAGPAPVVPATPAAAIGGIALLLLAEGALRLARRRSVRE